MENNELYAMYENMEKISSEPEKSYRKRFSVTIVFTDSKFSISSDSLNEDEREAILGIVSRVTGRDESIDKLELELDRQSSLYDEVTLLDTFRAMNTESKKRIVKTI